MIEKLLKNSLNMAKKILCELNEFYPFAEYIDLDNNEVNVSLPIQMNLNAKDAVIYLKKDLMEKYNQKKINSYAVVYNFKILHSKNYKDCDSIRIDVFINSKNISSFFYPYKINTKSIDYYEPYGERKRTIFD